MWGDREIMLRGQLQRALMAALASEAGKVIPADRLIDMLWGQQPPHSAKMKLQGLVSALRKAIGDYAHGLVGTRWPLITREPGYLLSLDGVRVDLRDYRELLRRADGELEAGFVSSASVCLGEALASWRGPALADVRSPILEGLAAALEQGRLLTIERKMATIIWNLRAA
jgi:DNA-binding SARP family transcriptional activator